MDSMDDYLKWKAKRQKVATATAVEGLRADFPEPPDKTGQMMQLGEMYAQETGNRQPDVPMVREYGTLFEKELQAKRAEKILAKSPMLAEWLRQPDNAAIGRDDLDGLSWWETGFGNSLKAGVKQVEQAGQQAVADQRIQNVQDQQRSFGEIVSDVGTINGPDGKPVYQSVIPGPLDLITGVSRFATSRLMPVQMDDALAAQMRVGEIANQIAALPMSPEAQKAFDDLGTLAPMATPQDAIQVLAGWVAGNPLGVVKMIAETGLRSLPPVAAGVTAGAVTKNPTVAASVMGGTSFAMERYSAPTEFYAEKGIDVSTPEGAMAVISNPELMQEAARRGVLRGVVIGAMDGLSGGVAGQTLAKSRLGNMLLQSVTQAAMGAAGETGGQLAAGQQLNFRDILLEALGEFATSPLEVAGMSIKSLNERMAAAKRAKDESARLAEVSKQSQQSKTRQRSPERFRRLVDAATVNGPVESVYVPAETFVQYFQSQGLDPYELADSSLSGVTRFDLETAVASGGDLKIPTSTYAARLAGTEHDAFLMENMKFDPEGMTFAEAQAFNEIADEARQAAFDEAERLRQEFEDLKSYDQQIYETMNERLRVAGRAADVASAEASLYPAFYRTMAERSEMTMEEFAARYPLPQVRGSIPQGMQDLGVDGLDRQLAEARKRKAAPKDNRQTLLEFISDAGGVFDVRGELKARNADQVKRKGKKTLKLRSADSDNAGQGDMVGGGAERQGFDVMARKAMEAGFLAGDPRVDEYRKSREDGTVAPDLGAALLDAIDRELAGQPEYSINDGAAAAGGSDLESYLDSLGVSLDNTDAEIKAAVEASQSGKSYEQGALNTDSEAFKKWFGDSKVVDANGNPLVVYHGTASDFEAFDKKSLGSTTAANSAKIGFFFTDNTRVAVSYANHAATDAAVLKLMNEANAASDAGDWETYDAKIVEMETLDASFRDLDRRQRGQNVVRAYLSIQNPMIIDAKGEVYSAIELDLTAKMKAAKRRGHDGVIIKNLDDAAGLTDVVADHYVVFEPTQIKGVNNRGTFDPNDPRILYQNARGAIQIPGGGIASGESVIRLFERADLSTFLHESGHFFMSVLQDLAAKGEESALVDLEALKTWWVSEAAGVAADGNKAVPGAGVTPADVIAFLAAGTATASEPPVPAGMVRMYHGGDPQGNGPLWFSTSKAYAEGYATKDGRTAGLWYIDVADTSEFVNDPDYADQGAKQGFTFNREIPAEIASQRKQLGGKSSGFGTTGDAAKDRAIDAGMQEQFARGFEQYLMDGKAPSIELRGAFEKFRAWLISVYKRLRGLNVNVSPELRNVFDRMLASDAEIEKAKDRVSSDGKPDFTAAELGLSPEDYAKLMASYTKGEDDAKAHMLREIMAPLKRDREKWFRDERAKVRAEMETAVNAKPVYRAIEWMGNGRWLGDEPQTGLPDMRLSKQILVDRYGAGVLDTLRKGRSTVYAASGGMDPDEAAGWFGFSSGDMLVRAIENAMPRRDAIEAETDREMRDRYGDLMTEGDIEAEAINAVHNDAALNALVKEYAALAALAGTPNLRMSARDARHAARLALARMTVRDAVKPNRFLAAERKAREESRVLSGIVARDGVWLAAAKRRAETGVADESFAPALRNNRDVMRLLQAKERAILNHALFEESRKVADEVAAAEKLAARLGKKSVRERLATAGRRGAVLGAENGIDYLGAIDELLEQYSFRKTSGRADQRQGAFRAYIDAMTAAGRGNELSVADDVLRRVAQVPYKTLKVEELRGVTDALKNLVHIAGRWNKLIDAKLERDLDAAVEGVTDAVVDNLPAKPPARFANKSENRAASVRKYFNIVLTATTLLREIDGFKDQGAAYTAIKAPIDDAMNRLQLRKEKAAADLEQLYSVYSKDERRAMAVRNHNPIIGEAVSKWEIIAIALNTGNEDNLQRLTDRRVKGSFSPMQVEAAVSSLSKKDWDFVQSVWDYINTYWPDIAEREKRATGTVPAKVEAKAIETPHGVYRGGYYPIKSDARLSNLAADDEGQNIANALAVGRFGKAQTRNGHTKARAESSGRALELDMSVLHRHINQVIYDLELSEPVANAWRILHDGRTRDAFRAAGRNTDHATLETWLKDVAEGELRSSDLVNVMARKFKSNFTAAKLAINMGVVLSQVAGISQSMVVVGKRDFAKGASLYISNPAAAVESVVARSPFMASRQTTFNKDIGDYYNDPKSGPAMSRYQEIRQKIIGPLAFWLMTKVQFLAVDMPTWMGGYEQGLRLFGNDEAKAIAHADDVVKRAQASGLFSDRSAIERGSLSDMSRQNDVVRLFTTLGSYMFAKFNIAYEKSVQAGRVVRSEGASLESFRAAMSWTADMVMLFTVDAVILAAIKGRLPGDDDDDGTVADDWAAFLAKETGFGMAGTLPFVRDIAGMVNGFQAGGAYGGIIHDLANPFVKMGSGKIDKSLLKSIANASAVMFGIPGVTQINKVIDAAARQAEGEDVSPMEYLLGKPPKK